MAADTIPLTILAGSDLTHGRAPEGSGQHTLAAYKGMALEVQGRPLIACLIERCRSSGAFDPVTVAGPRRIYGSLGADVQRVDTDADVATNLRAAVDAFLAHHPTGPLAVVTCDILPTTEELGELARLYRAAGPCDAWFPLVHAPADPKELGPFGYKPDYAVLPSAGADPLNVLPGHLLIFDPRALRIELVYRLMQAAYRTRNLSVRTRRRAMLRSVLLGLLWQDFLHLASLRRPDLTWTVLRHGGALVHSLRAGDTPLDELEQHVGRILIRSRHRRRFPQRGVRMPVVEALTLAEDVDTEEEARAAGARLVDDPATEPRRRPGS